MESQNYNTRNVLFRPGETYNRTNIFSPDRTRSPSAKREGSQRRSRTPGRRSSTSPSKGASRDRETNVPPPINRLVDRDDESVSFNNWQQGIESQQSGGAQQQEKMNVMDQVVMLDPWVTVFGFQQEDFAVVLQELEKYGNIVRYGKFGASERDNYTHVEFQNNISAQSAVQRSNMCLECGGRQIFVGVKPVSEEHKAMINSNVADCKVIENPGIKPIPLQPVKTNVRVVTQPIPAEKTFWNHVYDAIVGT